MVEEQRRLLGFAPATFAERRRTVLESLEGAAMLLPAAAMRYRSRDSEYRYRPDSELFYLTGAIDPGIVAVLRGDGAGGEGDEEFVLFVRARDEKEERWSGPRPGPEEALELYGADASFPLEELEERLPDLVGEARSLYYRQGADSRLDSLVDRALALARARGSRKGTGPRQVVDPGEILDEMRLRKDAEEIEAIRAAATITVEGFVEALAHAAPGAGEWEVEARLEGAFRRRGARGPAFPTIAGSGLNGCVLHYVRNGDRMEDGQLLLVDGGAEVRLYHGDVTRTVPVSGAFTDAQRSLYDVVEKARVSAVGAVAPGATIGSIHEAARDVLVAGMIDLGLLEGPAEKMVEEEAYKAFFPHNTSHWLGLDVHDPGDYARDGESRVLEPGMVLTIEPGLYVPLEAGVPQELLGTGVRIEDDILVTEDGRENLTESLPTDPEWAAELVAGAV